VLRELAIETLRSLRAHRLRYGLTSLGIVWGAFMLTYLSASMEGTERHFIGALERMGPRVVFMGGGVVLKREGDRVQVDFNHPFAGRSLALRVRVLDVS
jgi:hypothetical protein